MKKRRRSDRLSRTGDAVGTNLQERLLQHLECSKEQMMFSSNLMGAVWVPSHTP